jgi:cell fate regulator YaaT (PSP1 superfamily)
MGCSSCGTGGGCGSAGGCQNSGLCASGSCNKMNSYDWISTLEYDDPSAYDYVEVSFKNGARKEFYKNPNHLSTGDTVLVEVVGGGYDIGVIALSGELVRLQMKKKYTNEDRVALQIIRRANERDLEKLENKVDLERKTMVLSRAISASLGLDIKIGDVEYQGDMKKATFFFTSNGRVDFRELVRAYAKEFKVKIEMRQIGSRQESARIGGIGSCGRELCCSTWLSDFRSVNTTVARYQNIAINQTKLSGQCGRLKCCLNYELDAYVDALQHFPTQANNISTKKGRASLVKTDIFKGLMYYVYEDISMRGVFHPLDKEKVKEILAMNKKGLYPEDLTSFTSIKEGVEVELEYADVTGEIELPNNRKKKKKKPQSRGNASQDNNQRKATQPQQKNVNSDDQQQVAKSENTEKRSHPNDSKPIHRKSNQPRPQNSQGNKADVPPGQQPRENRNQPNKDNPPVQFHKERGENKPISQGSPMSDLSQEKKPGEPTEVKPQATIPSNPEGTPPVDGDNKKKFKNTRFFNKNKNKNK